VNIENLIARNYNDFEIKIATRNFKPSKSFLFIENIKILTKTKKINIHIRLVSRRKQSKEQKYLK
jgi:hypothetical protein